jgi:stage II sporulation SpoAA-like protein
MGLGSSSDSLMANAVGDGEASRGYAVYFNRSGVAVVTWDPTLRAVYTEAQGWSDPSEMAAVLEAGLQALTEYGGSRWLADGRNMKDVKRSDQDWIVQEFFPRALAAGLKRIALVIPKSVVAMKTVDQLVQRLPAAKVEVAYFPTVDEARSWLTESPPVL